MSHVTPAPQPSGGQLLSPAQAQAAKRSADHVRAHALLSIADGRMTVWDVLREASTPAGRPLLRLSLRQILLAQPGVGVRTAQGTLTALGQLAGSHTTTQSQADLTVQWLIDPRAHGRRMLAFLDVMDSRTGTAPWRGFPLAPPPGHAAESPIGA